MNGEVIANILGIAHQDYSDPQSGQDSCNF